MNHSKKIKLKYFSDLLCVWAYVNQARMNELKLEFNDRIMLKNRYLPIFGAVKNKLVSGWAQRGGTEGYAKHVIDVVDKFEYLNLHENTWRKVVPESSSPCHEVIKAVQILETENLIESQPTKDNCYKSISEEFAWQLRLDFFKNGKDISQKEIQMQALEKLKIPRAGVEKLHDSGRAMAALTEDYLLSKEMMIKGSPSLIMNEGRQILYGNVGYRLIRANIEELLNNPPEFAASWC